MARTLEFDYQGSLFSCEINTVNRRKLYGSVEIETLDADGGVCKLASLANDGKTIIPYGGTAAGYINPEGEWLQRKDLTAVDEAGDARDLVASSFDAPLTLDETVSVEDFLDHSIRLTYELKPEDAFDAALQNAVDDGAIFRTNFSYRGGVDADPAFVMAGEDGTVWLLIGSRNAIDLVNLESAASCASNHESDETEDDEDEDLDELRSQRRACLFVQGVKEHG